MIKHLPMRLQCICYITVAKIFADLHKHVSDNPMGVKWKDFPNIASSDCKRQVYLNTVPEISLKTQLRQQRQAEKLGYNFAISLLKEAGYVQ